MTNLSGVALWAVAPEVSPIEDSQKPNAPPNSGGPRIVPVIRTKGRMLPPSLPQLSGKRRRSDGQIYELLPTMDEEEVFARLCLNQILGSARFTVGVHIEKMCLSPTRYE